MESRKGKKCILYSRVSTEMQIDGYSLEAQTHGLKRYADREEMIVIDTYEDAGKSGKSIEGRPAFKRMLNDISQGLEIDYILVYKLSRFGRNAADILSSLEYVQSYGVNLICIEEGIDSSMTAGRLLISVLSAVAEIERENIIEQTMNGRREKARQGGWNGGFAPYGYKLENNKLLIAEDEADAIRIIFDKFINTDMGYNGVAKYLNLQGIKKKVRQNGTLTEWSSKTVKELIDNPIYCGKLAYGRRIREKVKGTKNEYKQVKTDNYILVDGEHEAIVSVEDWNKAKVKRDATGIKAPSKVGRDRAHLLTGILKCPVCGSPMYTNKNAWTNKDGKYNERFYYVCSRKRQQRGKSCSYSAQLMKEAIEPDVIMAIKQLVTNEEFAKEIKSRIGTEIDTTEIDKEIKNYETNLRQVENNKRRLESEIDSLPEDAKYRDRKLQDMNRRLDNLYDTIYELEDKIEESRAKRKSIEMSAITIDNVYKVLLNFDKVYDRLNDEEKRTMIQGFIKEIQIYPKEEQEKYEHPIKNITFNFPVTINGEEVDKISWEKGNTVETIVLLSKFHAKQNIEVELAMNALVHNDWTIIEPQISMFDNRLEILSHGGLPSGMTKEQFFEGISKPRNATLMRIFLSMGLTEHTGHGIPTIVKKYGEEVFEIEDNYIRCTIPFDKEVLDKLKTENVGLNKTEKKVVSLLIEDSEYTSDELAAKIGVTKRTIERTFISLQNKKVIERIGSKRDGSWIVIQ